MALDIYFQSDVANVLRALAVTIPQNADAFGGAHAAGFARALVAVGLAFGVDLRPAPGDVGTSRDAILADLLLLLAEYPNEEQSLEALARGLGGDLARSIDP